MYQSHVAGLLPWKFTSPCGAVVRVVAELRVRDVDAGVAAVTGDDRVPVRAAGVRLGGVVLRAAEQVVERVVRIDRDALELQRPQAGVHRDQAVRDLREPRVAVGEVGARRGRASRTARRRCRTCRRCGSCRRPSRRRRRPDCPAANAIACSSGCMSSKSGAVVARHVVPVDAAVGRAHDRAAVGHVGAGVEGELAVLHRAAEPDRVRMAGR